MREDIVTAPDVQVKVVRVNLNAVQRRERQPFLPDELFVRLIILVALKPTGEQERAFFLQKRRIEPLTVDGDEGPLIDKGHEPLEIKKGIAALGLRPPKIIIRSRVGFVFVEMGRKFDSDPEFVVQYPAETVLEQLISKSVSPKEFNHLTRNYFFENPRMIT